MISSRRLNVTLRRFMSVARKEEFLTAKERFFESKVGKFSTSLGGNERFSGLQTSVHTTVQTSQFSDKPQAANVDVGEVSRHESYKDWWNVDGPMMGLHTMNWIRLELIRNGLINVGRLQPEDTQTNPTYLNDIKIIEVGCGGGILCEPLARLGADTTGIDPSQELVDLAKRHANENAHTFTKNPPNYISSTIEDFSASNPGEFDVLVASEVIEHVPNHDIFVEACVKAVKPGGSIFITTPNRSTVSWLGTIILAEDILKILPKGIHDWNKFITPVELQQLMHKHNCKTVLVNGMTFNPMNRTWSWCSSSILHYALHAVKVGEPNS